MAFQVLENHWGYSDVEGLKAVIASDAGRDFKSQAKYLAEIYLNFPDVDMPSEIESKVLKFINLMFASGMGKNIIDSGIEKTALIRSIVGLFS